MFQTILSRFGWFIALLLLQALVFNHVHILGYATPMPYIFFLLTLSSDTPRWAYVLLGFLLGFCIDLFSNTPGMASGALCFSGLLVPIFLKMFAPKDNNSEGFFPSHKTMEWGNFIKFCTLSVIVYCISFFLLESFSFFDWQVSLINIISSSALTLLFVLAMELTRGK